MALGLTNNNVHWHDTESKTIETVQNTKYFTRILKITLHSQSFLQHI
jgi:hypothetical protein